MLSRSQAPYMCPAIISAIATLLHGNEVIWLVGKSRDINRPIISPEIKCNFSALQFYKIGSSFSPSLNSLVRFFSVFLHNTFSSYFLSVLSIFHSLFLFYHLSLSPSFSLLIYQPSLSPSFFLHSLSFTLSLSFSISLSPYLGYFSLSHWSVSASHGDVSG